MSSPSGSGARQQKRQIEAQRKKEEVELASSEDEIARRRDLIRLRGRGRSSLISTSLQGVQELGGGTNA